MKKNIILAVAAISVLSFMFKTTAYAQAPSCLLDRSDFETVIDDKPVWLHTITNGKIYAQVTNYCGYIVGLYAPDRDGNYENVVGHNDNIQQYQSFSRNPCGTALGRYANRIANATFTLDGVQYQVTKNNGQHMLHGGNEGFDHTVWDVVMVSDRAVIYSCVLEDGLDGFPGNLVTFLTFSITDNDGLAINFSATTDKATVCSMSHHAYFNLDGFKEGGDILGHVLTVDADTMTETDSTLIPTGKILPVEGTVFDFREGVRIGDRQAAMPAVRPAPGTPAPQIPEGMVRSFDQNFCLNHKEAGKIELVATLYSPESGRVMEVLNNHPGLQVYTGNRRAIALESQMFPDSPNHPEFPSTTLRPGETYKHTVIYRFSVK